MTRSRTPSSKPASTGITALPVKLPVPDQRLVEVEPGPDVLLTPRATIEIEEWISGWMASEQLLAADVSPPGPLFLHGPTGTGKTAVTKMLARRLQAVRPVYVIDAMRVTEGYVGATSANIARASDAAVKSGAVLVLEEIDTLASGRSYVHSADVENARATTSIMRVLELGGPIVLTSNRLDVIDPAVIRRCGYVVEMPALDLDKKREIVARELGVEASSVSLSLVVPPLTVTLPLARRARRTSVLSKETAINVFATLIGNLNQ